MILEAERAEQAGVIPAGLSIPRLRALLRNEDELFRVLDAIKDKKAFLMESPSKRSVMVLQSLREIHCWGVIGDMQEILDLEAEVTDRARANNYDRLTILPSRGGWDRALRGRGWRKDPCIALVKDLR